MSYNNVPEWCPGVQYNHGSRVIYQGMQYEIIQPHRSQSDWAPPIVPALWGCCGNASHQGNAYPPQVQQPQQQNSSMNGQGYNNALPPPSYQQQPQYQSSEPEKKNNFFGNISTGAAVTGGLIGAAALAGAAAIGVQQHKKNEAQKKEDAWNASEWQMQAQKRTHEYHTLLQQGRAPSVAWVLTSSNAIPSNAIECGRDSNGEPLYAARTPYRGGIHVGKVGRSFKEGCCFSWGGNEIISREYEVLVGNPNAVTWVEEHGHCNSNRRFVEGGFENGKPLFVGQASKNGGMHPGKCGPDIDGCAMGYGGKEHMKEKYRVLVYV